ncbi:MAG: nicotinamide mononucleotide transporter, partial [Paludibacteraceae bacterium]|nr:nicotinamide mononucleotide transporter [Paludibacteraceae bacterium]
FTTALSIVATWMLAKKLLENWLLWIVADAVSTGLYIYRGLYPTAILFTVYTLMAVLGYFQWKKSMREKEIQEESVS